METLRSLLALLCVFMAGAQLQQDQRRRVAGRFAENIWCFPSRCSSAILLHLKYVYCVECNEVVCLLYFDALTTKMIES